MLSQWGDDLPLNFICYSEHLGLHACTTARKEQKGLLLYPSDNMGIGLHIDGAKIECPIQKPPMV